MSAANKLYFGDNLDILRKGYVADGSVDLIYLDPPFNSKADYNVLFKEVSGAASYAQIKAFTDYWHWDDAAARAYEELVTSGPPRVSKYVAAMRDFLGQNDVLAYLVMMAPRLIELRRVLKEAGSLFLHCDATASHYLRLLLDAVFGNGCFRNEIVWHYDYGARSKRTFGTKHDTIFWYSKSPKDWTFNADAVLEPFKSKMTEWRYTRGGQAGKPMPAGKVPSDVWDIKVNAMSNEHLGYPTQKPLDLLLRIIKAASDPGNLVLDPFCGCGTTITAAQMLGRKWIGIDITHLAVSLMKYRLKDVFGSAATYEVRGEPVDVESARALGQQDRHQFQLWALGLVHARPEEEKKGADRGIDGLIFLVEEKGIVRKVVVQVKSGHVDSSQIRDLGHVIEREKAAVGLFITLNPSTREMRREAATVGFYRFPWNQKDYAKLQIRTIEELLLGKHFDLPPRPVQFEQAERYVPGEKGAKVVGVAENVALFAKVAEESGTYRKE